MKIPKVNIKQTYTFRVGEEINLLQAQGLITRQTTDTFRIKKYSRDLIIDDSPIIVSLPSWSYQFEEITYNIESSAKIWSFGAVSLSSKVYLQDINVKYLSRLVDIIESDEEFYKLSYEKVIALSEGIEKSITSPFIWPTAEDYTVIQIPNDGEKLESFREQMYSIIEGSPEVPLSQQMKDGLRMATFQYSVNDLIIMDWNRSLIYGDLLDTEELSDILEFALCKLLVLRYYDDLLDKKLIALHRSIHLAEKGFFKNHFAEVAKESALLYIDLSYIIESINNSFKFIGDTYYAKIYRASIDRFRVNDWHSTVQLKLQNMADISKMFSGEINERRNQLMELIIIILIAMEVLPFLYDLVTKYYTN